MQNAMTKSPTTIQTRKLPLWVGEAAVTYLREHGVSSRNVTLFLRTMPMPLEACTKVVRGTTTILIAKAGNFA